MRVRFHSMMILVSMLRRIYCLRWLCSFDVDLDKRRKMIVPELWCRLKTLSAGIAPIVSASSDVLEEDSRSGGSWSSFLSVLNSTWRRECVHFLRIPPVEC